MKKAKVIKKIGSKIGNIIFFVQTKAKRSKVQKFKKDTVILFALEQRQSEKVLAQDCGSNM